MAAPRTRPSTDRTIYMPTTSGVQIDPGDLLYESSGSVLPASSQADAGTPAGNRSGFAGNFVGVSNGLKRAEDATNAEVPIIVGSDVEFAVASATNFVVGEYLAATENSGGDGLEDQLVEKTTTANEAIAVVTENKTAATRVFAALITPLTGLTAS